MFPFKIPLFLPVDLSRLNCCLKNKERFLAEKERPLSASLISALLLPSCKGDDSSTPLSSNPSSPLDRSLVSFFPSHPSLPKTVLLLLLLLSIRTTSSSTL